MGCVSTKSVPSGLDKWFYVTDFKPYKYTNVILIKFIKETLKINL